MSSRRRKSKLKKWLITGIVLIVVAGIAAVFLMRPATGNYESVVAKTGDIITYYSFSGNIETKNRQAIMSDRIMQISEIMTKEGDPVKEGDTLIKTTAGEKIKSKINGEAANINVEVNSQVTAGAMLMEIIDYDNLEIVVKVDEYDIRALAEGKETTVKIGALDKEIKGVISSMSKEGQVMNGITYFVATIDLEKDASLRIGMSAEVKIMSDKAVGVVVLPMDAIQFNDDNTPYVFMKDEKSATVKINITTGINDGTMVEIKNGVSGGDTVLYPKAAAINIGFRRNSANVSGTGGGNTDG